MGVFVLESSNIEFETKHKLQQLNCFQVIIKLH